MYANSFPALIVQTVGVGIFVLALGGGWIAALVAMAATFALVGWFGTKWVVVTFLVATWAMFVEILKAVNPFRPGGEWR